MSPNQQVADDINTGYDYIVFYIYRNIIDKAFVYNGDRFRTYAGPAKQVFTHGKFLVFNS